MHKEAIYFSFYESPLGMIKITATEKALLTIHFTEEKTEQQANSNSVIEQAIKELHEYFSGKRKSFTVPYHLAGTEFQKKAWESLKTIPYGTKKSYQEQASAINNPKAVRAIGKANGANKLLIVLPCHRIIGKDGSLTGFGAELWRKKWLLEHEQEHHES